MTKTLLTGGEYIKDQLIGIIQTDDTMPMSERIEKFFNLE